MKKQFFAFLTTAALASCALAQVTVTAPWVRATVPQATAAGVFLQLHSAQDARLIEARSSVAGMVHFHRMEMIGRIMTMRPVSGINLAAGKPVDLASAGYHIMLMDLKRQLKEGETVALTLIIRNQRKKLETIDLKVPVKALTYSPDASPNTAPAKPQ